MTQPATPADAIGGPYASVVLIGTSADELALTLDTLGTTAPAAELIVVAPDPVDADGATVVCTPEGAGPLLGANQGADVAAGEIIVVLAAGVRVRPGWLGALLAPFSDPAVGVTGPKLLGEDGSVAAAGLVVRGDGSVEPFGRGLGERDPAANTPLPVDALSGVCLAVRAATWQELGGFDARYAPAGCEDVDLCFAARAAGWEVRYAPDAEVEADAARLSWVVGRERFAAKWRTVLARQEPAAWPGPASPDRSRRAVDLARTEPRRAIRADRVVAVAAATRHGRLADRARSIAAVLRAAGRTVDLLDTTRLVRLPPDCDVWAVGLDAVEQVAVAAGRSDSDAVLVADVPSVRSVVLRHRAAGGDERAAAEAAAAEESERWVLALADMVVTSSDAAASRLRALATNRLVSVVPLASAVGPPRPLPGRGRPSLVVRVDASDDNDVSGARWLLREVVPRVQLTFADLSTTVLGDATRPEVRQLAGPGVNLSGAVTFDAMSLPVRAAVAPWRVGSGMHPWTVEALAWGIPLVTTTAGAEGVPIVAGEDAVVIDDADGMARALVALITDHTRWAWLSAAGQAVVRARLDPATIAAGLGDLLSSSASAVGR